MRPPASNRKGEEMRLITRRGNPQDQKFRCRGAIITEMIYSLTVSVTVRGIIMNYVKSSIMWRYLINVMRSRQMVTGPFLNCRK